jgi:hypothetical protein
MTARTCLATLALAALLGPLTAQEPTRIPLDGAWQIRAAGDEGPWQPVVVPGAFEAALGVGFDGIAVCRRTLPKLPDGAAAVFVAFDAVATHAEVRVNGEVVGEHLGGWTPFRVDATQHLRRDGSDLLEVVVDERVGHNTQGFLPIVQPHFGGIWQPVHLLVLTAPAIDATDVLVFGRADGSLQLHCGVVGDGLGGVRADGLVIEVLDGDRVVLLEQRALHALGEPLRIPDARPWSPSSPHLYTARLTLLAGERPLDVHERRFGCRTLTADGTRISWNAHPLQVRGILHWGYSPPHLAPPSGPGFWRPQLEYFKSLGFNCLKCCLWQPPRCVHDLCDELGLIVWQEYPTWHPKLDQAHKDELLREYDEFFRHDRAHPSVAFRSITCETGPQADLDVVTALFQACKARVPDTLVVDDSSWLGWQRITDFWDEHPYGNNTWLPTRIEAFRQHLLTHGHKPILLGECIAADTWLDRAAWLERHGDAAPWWQPWCLEAQAEAERWLAGEFGVETLASLGPIARDFGLQNRQFQIERLRLTLPDTGFVVSVARDFTKARMGLYDDLDRPKWTADEWAWHGDTMLCLDLPAHGRALAGPNPIVPVVVSHYGQGPLTGKLRLRCRDLGAVTTADVRLDAGQNGAPVELHLPWRGRRLQRVRIDAELTGSHPARSHWHVWLVPDLRHPPLDVVETDHLDADLLRRLEAGGRVLLHVRDVEQSLKSEAMWFLKGAPFAPPHPAHRELPREALLELSSFDLESGRVVPWEPWRDEVDPILAFWETHDIRDVRFHLLAFETRVGKGRLLATTFGLEGSEHSFAAHVRHHLKRHLTFGPEPEHALTPATIASLHARLTARTIELPHWRFRCDPEQQGLDGRWFDPAHGTQTPAWRDLEAGRHWEHQAEDLAGYDGVAWYRVDVDVPADWRGLAARLVLDGVDDSCTVWLNGVEVGRFGDPATSTSVWLEQQVQELGDAQAPGGLRAGERNIIVLRVVDHHGAGGLWKPARLTTGPAGRDARRLR